MSLIGNKRVSSNVQNLNSDERAAASDFATIIRADEGSTVNFGASAADLQNILGFQGQQFAAQRDALAQQFAGAATAGGGGGIPGWVIAAGLAVGVVLLVRG